MIIVHVELQKIIIEKFSLNAPMELRVYFDDGKKKATLIPIDLTKPEESAEKIIFKIRSHEKKENSKWQDLDREELFGNIVNVIIKDEERVTKRIAHFINDINSKIHQLKSKSTHKDYVFLFGKVRDIKLILSENEK